MTSDGELSFNEMILFVDDLKTHCERDFDVVYLPNERPIQGRCPANGCHQEIARLGKSNRSAHIHECVRREVALDRHLSESQLSFCYESTRGWSEVIDPRILHPPETKDYRKACRDESEQYNLLECSQHDEATVGRPLCGLSDTQYTQS
ncbi:hypothetical protein ZTR_03810 [Talaromyces verruculosus]|nr:hypothetical protein ZTR_03810 [Talaromyces verruculosus]